MVRFPCWTRTFFYCKFHPFYLLPSYQGVFIWRRRVSHFGRASPSKRAGFHLAFTWEKPALLPGLARLAESPGLTTSIFPRNPIFAYKFSFYNKQNL